ncbi:hypothetical protein LWI28_028962 [Acer negundo]|uniref:NAC domain-containing protein n=1 Tax=Acer negundo TaxID=4023 RepID=A0AAD5P3J0_ACENE|nr:hypothetical protein LWI28_028962 [Acer negundo]
MRLTSLVANLTSYPLESQLLPNANSFCREHNFPCVSNLMGSLVGYRLTFQPTSEELVSHFLKKKSRDPAFTHPAIRDVNVYKHHPCELPGLASIQSDEQVWYFFCTLDNKYAKTDRASRTAMGGSWKITGTKRDGKVVVCRIERKPNKKHHGPSSAVDDNLAYDSGNNVAQHYIVPEIESQLLSNQYLSYNNTEDDVAKEVKPLLVPAEWDALIIGYNELQSPISSGDEDAETIVALLNEFNFFDC